MQFNLKTIATLLAVISPIFAQDAASAPADSAVVKLTSDNFEQFLKENPLVLAEFFAPWCGHCKALGPEYIEAASQLEDKNIKLAQIDCTEQEALCQAQGIRGYPTLSVFRGPDDKKPYEGARKAEAIATYMIKQSQPAVQTNITSSDLTEIVTDAKEPVVVQILPEATASAVTAANETYYTIANSKRDKYTFLASTDAKLAKEYGADAKKPAYLVYRAGQQSDEKPAVFSEKEITSEGLTSFIDYESKPYFGEINGETFQDYMTAKIPLAYLFYNTPEERKDWETKITKYAKKYRGKLNFVGLDASRFGRHAENLNQEEKFPLFAIHDLEKNLKYGLDQAKDLAVADIEKLLTDFSAGSATPKIKSEEIPKTQDQAVYKLVAHTHDKIINDDKKDVLVLYHATWCGHCKRLAPTYEELAQVYQKDKNASDKVLITSIEATQNDVNVEIQGFPTLILYPAGDKSNPVPFEESRDLESLAEFIKKNGGNKIDGLALKKQQEDAAEVDDEEEEEEVHDEL